MAKKKQKRYTARERKAYWIGVGMSLGSAAITKTTRSVYDDYYCNLSDGEHNSLQAGLNHVENKGRVLKARKK